MAESKAAASVVLGETDTLRDWDPSGKLVYDRRANRVTLTGWRFGDGTPEALTAYETATVLDAVARDLHRIAGRVYDEAVERGEPS